MIPQIQSRFTDRASDRRIYMRVGEAMRGAYNTFIDFFVVPSSSGASLAYLDGIRALAVIFVVVFHVWALSGMAHFTMTTPVTHRGHDLTIFLGTGYVGVILFFVLSGFLLSQHWLHADFQGRPRPSGRVYLRRRLLRIIPGYYVCLFLTLLLLCPFLIPPQRIYSASGAFVLGAHLLFLQYIFPSANSGSFNIHGHMWTLTIEMIFYLALPFVVVLFFRRRWMIALPLSVLASLTWLYLAKQSLGPLVHLLETRSHLNEGAARYFLSQQFPAHFVSFAFGIALANLAYRYHADPPIHRLLRPLTTRWMGIGYFFVGCFIVVYTMNAFGYPGPLSPYYFWEPSVSIGFSLMIGGVILGGRALQVPFSFLPLRLIGIIGYSAYLWHMPLIYLINTYPAVAALPPQARFFHVLVYVTIALTLVSSLMYLTVEKPFLLLGRRYGTARAMTTARLSIREQAMAQHIAPSAASLPTIANPADG